LIVFLYLIREINKQIINEEKVRQEEIENFETKRLKNNIKKELAKRHESLKKKKKQTKRHHRAVSDPFSLDDSF